MLPDRMLGNFCEWMMYDTTLDVRTDSIFDFAKSCITWGVLLYANWGWLALGIQPPTIPSTKQEKPERDTRVKFHVLQQWWYVNKTQVKVGVCEILWEVEDSGWFLTGIASKADYRSPKTAGTEQRV